jgi:hypothetical protein
MNMEKPLDNDLPSKWAFGLPENDGLQEIGTNASSLVNRSENVSRGFS